MTLSYGNSFPNRFQLPDWAATSLLQPLPRTVRPVRDETLESYLWRLAHANGLNPHYLIDYLKGRPKRQTAPVPAEVVIKVSGQPATSMRYALLELCSQQELAVMKVAGRPRPGSSPMGRKCIRCTQARDIHEPVTCWRRTEDVICLCHRMWVTETGQVDLSGHEEIVQANKQHRKLIRRYGRVTAGRAFRQASSIISEWVGRNLYRELVSERMRRFHGSGWQAALNDPSLLAAEYVPAVALTRLLADPGWKALALDPEGNAVFVAEVRSTVEPSYSWYPYPYWRYVEPLARTLLDEREIADFEAERHRRYHGPELLPWRSEVIGSDELRQDG